VKEVLDYYPHKRLLGQQNGQRELLVLLLRLLPPAQNHQLKIVSG